MKTIVVLGASGNPERTSNEAVQFLLSEGYRVVLVNPALSSIGDIPVARSLREVPKAPDAVTMYINPARSSALRDDLVWLAPGTVVFNPGSENDELEACLVENGIRTIRACTIVLLKTGRFEKAIGEHQIQT